MYEDERFYLLDLGKLMRNDHEIISIRCKGFKDDSNPGQGPQLTRCLSNNIVTPLFQAAVTAHLSTTYD